MKILVTGGNGQLGRALRRLAPKYPGDFIPMAITVNNTADVNADFNVVLAAYSSFKTSPFIFLPPYIKNHNIFESWFFDGEIFPFWQIVFVNQSP